MKIYVRFTHHMKVRMLSSACILKLRFESSVISYGSQTKHRHKNSSML